MKVLVTGGAGYIGSHMALALLRAGHDVVVVDDLSAGHRDAVPAGATFVQAGVADRERMRDVLGLHAVEAILHFAGRIEVGESMRDPRRYYERNVAATIALLDAALDARVGRFVLSSTAAVYGDPVRVPIDEDHPTSPINPYGDTKLAVERMLAAYGRAYGLRWAALRYFNAAGADVQAGLDERHDPETHLLPIVLDVALGRREAVDRLRRGLRHPRRHLRARLHPRPRSVRRAPPGAGAPGRRRRGRRVQPRDGAGALRGAGHRDRAARQRARGARRPRPATPRGPAAPRRVAGARVARPRMAGQACVLGGDRARRVASAVHARVDAAPLPAGSTLAPRVCRGATASPSREYFDGRVRAPVLTLDPSSPGPTGESPRMSNVIVLPASALLEVPVRVARREDVRPALARPQYVYGDSTPFPSPVDFIATIRALVGCGVSLMKSQHAIECAKARVTEAQEHLLDLNADLGAMASAVEGAITAGGPRKAHVREVGHRIATMARGAVTAEVRRAQAALDASVVRADRTIVEARKAAALSFGELLARHDLPGASTGFRIFATDDHYGAEVVVSLSCGLRATFDATLPEGHAWRQLRRVRQVREGVMVTLPQEVGLFSKRIEQVTLRLDGLMILGASLEGTRGRSSSARASARASRTPSTSTSGPPSRG